MVYLLGKYDSSKTKRKIMGATTAGMVGLGNGVFNKIGLLMNGTIIVLTVILIIIIIQIN